MAGRDSLYRVTNVTRNVVLADNIRKPGAGGRGIGLMFQRSLPPKGGLIIQPCNSVVSFFMRFPIDVLFLDADGAVCHALHDMPPWRVSKIVKGSKAVVELPTGTLRETGTEPGDSIVVEAIQPAEKR